jgi:hypothetical protein
MIIVKAREVSPKRLAGKRQNSLHEQVFFAFRSGVPVGRGA